MHLFNVRMLGWFIMLGVSSAYSHDRSAPSLEQGTDEPSAERSTSESGDLRVFPAKAISEPGTRLPDRKGETGHGGNETDMAHHRRRRLGND